MVEWNYYNEFTHLKSLKDFKKLRIDKEVNDMLKKYEVNFRR